MSRLQNFHLRRKPVAVIDQLRNLRDQAIPKMHHLPVHGDRFDGPMGNVKNRPPGRLIDPSRLHPHIAVLHHIDTANSILASQFIQSGQQVRRREGLAIDPLWNPVFKIDFNDGRTIRRLFRRRRRGETCPLAALTRDLQESLPRN